MAESREVSANHARLFEMARDIEPIFLESVDTESGVATITSNGIKFTEVKLKGVGNISVKLDLGASDVISGLKAIQREARGATKALKELESAQADTTVIDTSEGSIVHTIATHFGWSPQDVIQKSPEDIAFLYRVAVKGVVISGATTEALSEELEKREGVTSYYVGPHGDHAIIKFYNEEGEVSCVEVDGATIIVNKD